MKPVLVGNVSTVSQLTSVRKRQNGNTVETILREEEYVLLNTRARPVCNQVRVNRQDSVIIDFIVLAPMSPFADNSTLDLSFRRTANDEEAETLCMKLSPHQSNLQLASLVNRSLKRLEPQYYMLEVKQYELSTIVLTSQVESTH
jgi:hypothetical protein